MWTQPRPCPMVVEMRRREVVACVCVVKKMCSRCVRRQGEYWSLLHGPSHVFLCHTSMKVVRNGIVVHRCHVKMPRYRLPYHDSVSVRAAVERRATGTRYNMPTCAARRVDAAEEQSADRAAKKRTILC